MERFFRRMVGDGAWERLGAHQRADRRADGPALLTDLRSLTGAPPFDLASLRVRAVVAAGRPVGPGCRAYATLARPIGLIVQNAFGIHPHVLDQTTQGVPGRWQICIGENEEESPWEPLHVELGYQSNDSTVAAVHVRSCEFVDHRHSAEPRHILYDLALTISRTGGGARGMKRAVVVLGPEHAQALARRGLSKQDVKESLAEHVGQTRGQLRPMGRRPVSPDGPADAAPPGMFATGPDTTEVVEEGPDDEFFGWVATPDDLLVVVSGAANAGVSAVAQPLGLATNLPGRAVVAVAP